MVIVSITEFRKHMGYYLELVQQDNIAVTKYKKIISIFKKPKTTAIDRLLSLRGCLKEFDDGRLYEDIIGDAIMKKQGLI